VSAYECYAAARDELAGFDRLIARARRRRGRGSGDAVSGLLRARVVRRADVGAAPGSSTASTATGVTRPYPASPPRARRVSRAELVAGERAAAIVAAAEARAREVHEEAVRRGEEEGRAAGEARLAAAWLTLRAAEERNGDRALDRSVELASLLAERLLGEALAIDPTRIGQLAREALAEARGARRVVFEANAADAEALMAELARLGFSTEAVEIQTSKELSRGSLRIHTDLGTVDANLTLRIERLARALRDALQPA
jgi:flagellar assembly protein FliH/type III secretion protein L